VRGTCDPDSERSADALARSNCRFDGEPPEFPSCNNAVAPVVAADGNGGILQAPSNEPNDPAVSIDPCGNAVAIWSESESGRTRTWANRYETACP